MKFVLLIHNASDLCREAKRGTFDEPTGETDSPRIDAFFRDYVGKKPVIFTDVKGEWGPVSRWTPDYFRKIGGELKNFQVPSNRSVPAPPGAPKMEEIKLINYDFAKYGSAAERKRLLEKWDRDVYAIPR